MPTTVQAASVAAVVFVAHAVAALAYPRRGTMHTAVDLVFPVMGLFYVPLAALAARSAQGRLRTAWWVLTAAFGCWALGEALYMYYEITGGAVPVPSWADAAYFAYIPLVLVALLLFPTRGTWRDKGRLILDGLIITGSFFLISWLTVLRTFWQDDAVSDVESAIGLGYRIGDVLILSVGLLVLVRLPHGLRLTMTLLVAGFFCSALATGLWTYTGNTFGQPIAALADVLYSANSLLVIVGLVAAQHAKPAAAGAPGPPGWLSLWLPLVPLALAAVYAARAQPGVATEPAVVVTGALLMVATLLRQLAESVELVRRERRIRLLADRLSAELNSASQYVASILPGDLSGPVEVHSRYRPSRAVGGDCFGYTWIDDDHLIVYLIDVSGHGVRPALLSVSVHNLLRSGALPAETLLAPDRVLAELNARFGMDDQDGHYFTIWYGVFELSTGRLRNANAGHPPPLVLTARDGVSDCAPLDGAGMPVGIFADTPFSARDFMVPPGARIVLYSDGVLGERSSIEDFAAVCTRLSAPPQEWLDRLVAAVPTTGDGQDEDDCSVVLLDFRRSGSLLAQAS